MPESRQWGLPKVKGQLTAKEKLFVKLYAGNACEAATLAGFKQPRVYGPRLVNRPRVAEAIRKRQDKQEQPLIASREERQQFWTKFLRNQELEPRDRLKASELLGKSQIDFVERKEVSGPGGDPIQLAVALTPSLAAIVESLVPDAQD